ncbi:MAG TPA: PfkB family carbohydrate kinase [Candidatus Limnocylindria bacterium]|nr:PfkB family carbohydrate kinase [Candidatus Limnocylindria bacterium]
MSIDLLAIGHVARDEFEGEPTWRLGGTALYAAATAARLGVATALVTRVGPAEKEALEERCEQLRIAVRALPSSTTTTFGFRYVDGRRMMRLRARARGIAPSDVPAEWRGARAVVLGSVAHELERSLFGTTAANATVLVAQGYLREWSADGAIRPREWEDADEIVPRVTAVVLSEDDVAGDLSAPRRWSRSGRVYVTLAERGVLVLDRGSETTIAGYAAARVVDPTGAGDAFAAGLALALADGRPADDCARYANAVASFAVEGVGMEGLADSPRVAERMR